jgi:hypothetical protein
MSKQIDEDVERQLAATEVKSCGSRTYGICDVDAKMMPFIYHYVLYHHTLVIMVFYITSITTELL